MFGLLSSYAIRILLKQHLVATTTIVRPGVHGDEKKLPQWLSPPGGATSPTFMPLVNGVLSCSMAQMIPSMLLRIGITDTGRPVLP